MKKIFFTLTVLGTLVFSACQKANINTNSGAGTMTITKDGVALSAPSNFNNTLLELQQNGQTGRRLDLRATVGNETYIISVSNWSFQNPPANGVVTKTYDTNTHMKNTPNGTGPNQICQALGNGTFCDSGLGTYTDANNQSHMSENAFMSSTDPVGAIIITQNNTTDKTVTGTFDFRVYRPVFGSGTPTTIEHHITGTFTDLVYTVL